MLERLLERISISKYNEKFILKGGMLISALVGVDMRATMDMDATIKDLPLKSEVLESIMLEIISIDLQDEVTFKIKNTKDIRENDEYGGYKISLEANLDGIKVPLKIDITTGDKITPKEIKYSFKLIFEDRSINILAYNIETVIAEKIETVITRGVDNTRARDFYDLYILNKNQNQNIDEETLKNAIIEKFNSRGTINNFKNMDKIYLEMIKSIKLKSIWNNYRINYSYAEDIEFEKVIFDLNYYIKLFK